MILSYKIFTRTVCIFVLADNNLLTDIEPVKVYIRIKKYNYSLYKKIYKVKNKDNCRNLLSKLIENIS